jgi:hypothetical protein
MEYFFYCRARPDSEALWNQLTHSVGRSAD